MFHFFEPIRDTKGRALIGYYVRLVDGSGNGVSLYADSNSTPIISVSGVADAAIVDSDGNANFYCNVGTYTINTYATDSTTLVKTVVDVPMLIDDAVVASASNVNIVAANIASVETCATNIAAIESAPTYAAQAQAAAGAATGTPVVITRTALAALTATSGMTRQLTESGYEGVFVFSTSNFSTQVTADPNQISYVAPSSDTTGASGAWVRTRNLGARLSKPYVESLPLGDIVLPTQFNNQLGLTPYWDGTQVQWPRNPYDVIDFTKYNTCNNYYVNAAGNDTNNGTSSGTAWRTLPHAVANAVSPAIIHLTDDYVGITGFLGNASLQFSGMLKIIGSGPTTGRTRLLARRESENLATFAWTASGGNGAYVSTVAAALRNYNAMFDGNYKNIKGIPKPITVAASAAACQTTPGTFYYDGSANLYVHMWDGRIPDPDNGWWYSEAAAHFEVQQVLSTSAGVILLENLEVFYNTGVAGTAGCRYSPVTAGSVNSVRYGRRNVLVYGAGGNGFETFDASIAVSDNCHAYFNHIDNHNWHSFVNTGTKGAYITFYEHNCTSGHGGFTGWANQNTLSTSANGTTMHDSINCIRTNGYHFDTNGSVVADVNGALSVNLNIHASHPNAGGSATPRSCFWHDNTVAAGTYNGMYLWGCSANDDGDPLTNLLDMTKQSGGTQGQIYLKYWRGQTNGNVIGALKDWSGNPV